MEVTLFADAMTLRNQYSAAAAARSPAEPGMQDLFTFDFKVD
jgi:hypothetical protein